MNDNLDHRLNAYRPDLADVRLKDRVEAEDYAVGTDERVVLPVADLKSVPDRAAETQTQVLMGEALTVFERAGGWCWVQARTDGYVGYVEETACRAPKAEPTHRVVVPRTFLYPRVDLRFPPVTSLSAGSLIEVVDQAETRGVLYDVLADGTAVIARHCLPIGEVASTDYVSVAESFMETPYLWGGRSGFGVDCSGLVQLALQLADCPAPRDSDMQAAGLGQVFEPGADLSGLRRGDFVFWNGHVGMLQDPGDAAARQRPHHGGHQRSTGRSRRPHRRAIRNADGLPAPVSDQYCAERSTRLSNGRPASCASICRIIGGTSAAGTDVAAACGVIVTRG